MKSKAVKSSVLSRTSVSYSNHDGGKCTCLSIASSDLQLELTGSLFLY